MPAKQRLRVHLEDTLGSGIDEVETAVVVGAIDDVAGAIDDLTKAGLLFLEDLLRPIRASPSASFSCSSLVASASAAASLCVARSRASCMSRTQRPVNTARPHPSAIVVWTRAARIRRGMSPSASHPAASPPRNRRWPMRAAAIAADRHIARRPASREAGVRRRRSKHPPDRMPACR